MTRRWNGGFISSSSQSTGFASLTSIPRLGTSLRLNMVPPGAGVDLNLPRIARLPGDGFLQHTDSANAWTYSSTGIGTADYQTEVGGSVKLGTLVANTPILDTDTNSYYFEFDVLSSGAYAGLGIAPTSTWNTVNHFSLASGFVLGSYTSGGASAYLACLIDMPNRKLHSWVNGSSLVTRDIDTSVYTSYVAGVQDGSSGSTFNGSIFRWGENTWRYNPATLAANAGLTVTGL